MIERIKQDWSAMIVGAVLGIGAVLFAVSVGPSLDDIAWRTYDDLYPVAEIEAKTMPGPVGEVRVILNVVRNRGECRFVGPAAFEILPGGAAVRVFAARVDGQGTTDIPERVRFNAEWRFWPVGIGKLKVWMDYLCDGRPVRIEVKGLT